MKIVMSRGQEVGELRKNDHFIAIFSIIEALPDEVLTSNFK